MRPFIYNQKPPSSEDIQQILFVSSHNHLTESHSTYKFFMIDITTLDLFLAPN